MQLFYTKVIFNSHSKRKTKWSTKNINNMLREHYFSLFGINQNKIIVFVVLLCGIHTMEV